MPSIFYVFGAIFVGLLVIWPISFFGYKFYEDTIHAEQPDKH